MFPLVSTSIFRTIDDFVLYTVTIYMVMQKKAYRCCCCCFSSWVRPAFLSAGSGYWPVFCLYVYRWKVSITTGRDGKGYIRDDDDDDDDDDDNDNKYTLKPGSHLWDKHKHKHKKNRVGTAWNKRELSISISTRKINFFQSLCLCLLHACAYFTSGNRREVSTSTSKMIPLSWISFQISSNVEALAFALFSCACFTCGNVANLCLCLSHKWEPGFMGCIFETQCVL